MSGPIIRKYGFPNFEQIFGKRELEHGLDTPAETPKGASEPASDDKTKPAPAPNSPAK